MEAKKLSRREFLKVATAGIGGATLLAACAPVVVQQQAETGSAAAVEGEQGEAPQPEVTVLTFGRHWEAAFRPHQEEWDNMFMERHPEIVVKRTYNTWADHNRLVPTWAAAGTLPDIVYVHGSRTAPWANEDILIPIDDFVDNDEEFNVQGIWEESLRLYRWQGKQYCIPYDHGPIILGYNKDIFDAAGYPYPDETWTMDDLLEAAKALTDVDNQQWGWSGNYPNFNPAGNGPTLRPWGGELMNEDETKLLLDTPEAKEALQWWVDLIHVHKVAPTPAESQAFEAGAWQGGQVAMSNVASWNTPTLARFSPFSWDVAPWPEGPAGRGTGSFGSGYGITTASDHPDVGWTYLREYLSVDGMIFMWGNTGRGSPARKDAYDAWMNSEIAPEHAEFFLDALENYAKTDSPFQTLAAAEVLEILGREADLMRNGDTTVDEAVASIIADVQPLLDEAASKL